MDADKEQLDRTEEPRLRIPRFPSRLSGIAASLRTAVWLVVWTVAGAVVGNSGAHAQTGGAVPDAVLQQLGPLASAQLTAEDLEALASLCPDGDAQAQFDCLSQSEEAGDIFQSAVARALDALRGALSRRAVDRYGEQLLMLPEWQMQALIEACPRGKTRCVKKQLENPPEPPAAAGADDFEYPPEALELLPREVLDALPKVVTRFLRGPDYQSLKEACPQEDVAEVIECVTGDDGLALLETLHERAVIATLLEYMDVELPERLSPEETDQLAEHCDKQGEAWATCGFEKGLEHEECSELEEKLAQCLVGNDLTGERYLALVKEKKAIFGSELYVEFAGLMAVLKVEQIKAVRAACPQTEVEAAAECFTGVAEVADIIGQTQAVAQVMTNAAQESLVSSGYTGEFDVEGYTEKFFFLFLQMPVHTISKLGQACEKRPEMSTLDDPAKIDLTLTCIETLAMTDAIANPAYISPDKLRAWLQIARDKVTASLAAKERAAQNASFKRVGIVLALTALLGALIILAMPLFLRKRYPGHDGLLWRASAVAAGTFVLTIAMLGVTLLIMRSAQGALATDSTSPKMRIAEAVFDVLKQEDYVEGLSALSQYRLDFIKGPLKTIVEDTLGEHQDDYDVFIAYVAEHWATILKEPEIQRLAENKKILQEQIGVFEAIIDIYRSVDWLLGIVPVVLSLLAVILYLVPLRQTLVDIITAPTRALAAGGGSSTTGQARAMVTAEFKSVLPFLGVILILLPLVGIFLALAVKPLIGLILAYAFLTIQYLLSAKASAGVLYASLGGVMLLLVLCVAVYILCMVFFTSTVRKILRSKFHFGHALSSYKRFWGLGGAVLVAVLLFPMIYAMIAHSIFESWELADTPSSSDMVVIPLVSCLAFPVLFWLVRAWRGLTFIRKYPVMLGQGFQPQGGPQGGPGYPQGGPQVGPGYPQGGPQGGPGYPQGGSQVGPGHPQNGPGYPQGGAQGGPGGSGPEQPPQ